MTIDELKQLLEEISNDLPDDAEVRIAMQPSYPFEHSIALSFSIFEGRLYLSEGDQVGYLPGQVSEDLGWRR